MGRLVSIAKVGQPVTLADLPVMTFHNAPRAPVILEVAGRVITARGQGRKRVRLDVQPAADDKT